MLPSDHYVPFRWSTPSRSTKYELGVIFLNHKRVSQIEATIDGFPVIHSYLYLGVTLDNKGNLMPQLKAIEKRAKYLISAMKYFTQKELSLSRTSS